MQLVSVLARIVNRSETWQGTTCLFLERIIKQIGCISWEKLNVPQARLMRSESNRVFAGVCGGVATYLGIDAIFVRLAFLLLTFASGIGILLYLILMILMPGGNSDSDQSSSEVIQNNLERFGNDVSSGVEKMRRHPQGPTIAAGLLILLGIYFLLENVGWLYWFNGDWLWPMAIIGLGLYLLIRRNRA